MSSNNAHEMPDITRTLGMFFYKLEKLDLSNNCITQINALNLIKACPHLRVFIIRNNCISELDEFVPLGKLKKLEILDFNGNLI